MNGPVSPFFRLLFRETRSLYIIKKIGVIDNLDFFKHFSKNFQNFFQISSNMHNRFEVRYKSGEKLQKNLVIQE